jgi:uncharacterized NAD(P)/FAD-binding protein YdhS
MQANAQGTAPAIENRESSVPRLIAIVGGGFSGTSLAYHLLRQAPPAPPTRIVIVEPRVELGAGVAYTARDYPYPLNVAAGQMSIDTAHPNDFLEFARAQGIHAEAGDYLPRQVFGDYVRTRFSEARSAAPAHVECVHRRASALRVRPTVNGQWQVWLDDGTTLNADEIVLATGNPPPASLPNVGVLENSERYIRDPWSLGTLDDQDVHSVLLIGSGLTMIDAALRLAAIRPRLKHIHVLSRHGLLPQPQAASAKPPRKPDMAKALEHAQGSIRKLVRVFRDSAARVLQDGGDWREVLGIARPLLPTIWKNLDHGQRARFLRHVRAVWDVHRHRAPAGPLAAVQSLARLGILDVRAGRIEEINPADDAIEVLWRPRGETRTRAWLVDRIVNCTGPDHRVDRHNDPLLGSLLANGLLCVDELSLGIRVAPDLRVISSAGAPVDSLYYIGPWLRARDWEATAVPELREHAARLAQMLAVSSKGTAGIEAR